MTCEVKQEQDMTVVVLSGEIDRSCTAKIRRAVLECLDHEMHLAVDMRKVSYIDSSGIACLVEGLQKAKDTQRRFSLVAVSDQAMKVLKLARLDRVFSIFASAEEACRCEKS